MSEPMYSRDRVIMTALTLLFSSLFSVIMAYVLVTYLGWRYTDITGLIGKPFDARASVFAFSMIGVIVWPIILTLGALVASDLARGARRLRGAQ